MTRISCAFAQLEVAGSFSHAVAFGDCVTGTPANLACIAVP
jgi:hypothetical protein